MKHSFLILTGLLLSFFYAEAQAPLDEYQIAMHQQQLLMSSIDSDSDLSWIVQTGTNNQLVSLQANDGLQSNQVQAQQNGMSNSGYINQQGENHQTSLMQTSFYNEANLWSIGAHTLSSIQQIGEYNVINSYIDNQSTLSKQALLSQVGNNNRIDLALLGDPSSGVSTPHMAEVLQLGNTNQLTLILDYSLTPFISITQDSRGLSTGASLSIIQTAFSFPMK